MNEEPLATENGLAYKRNQNPIQFYESILQLNGLNNYYGRIKNVTVTPAGKSCTCTCAMVTLQFCDPDEQGPIDLFVKTALTTEEKEDVGEMFEKEKLFFNSLLNDLNSFGREKIGTADTPNFLMDGIVPKFYFADCEVIVMENLTKSGYHVLPETACHSSSEAGKCMETLAKFHASTYTLLGEMGLQNFLQKYPFTRTSMGWSSAGAKVVGAWVDRIINGAVKCLKTYPVKGSERVYDHLSTYGVTAFDKLCRHFELNPDTLGGHCVNHGDLWNCNFMFKKRAKDVKKVEECIVLDFQCLYVGTPAMDLQYYLFVSVQKDVRRTEWKELLRIYYKTFKKFVTILGGHVKFSFEDLLKEYRAKCETGFILGLDPFYYFDTFGDLVGEDIGKVLSNDQKGLYYSREIVRAFEEYENLIFERD